MKIAILFVLMCFFFSPAFPQELKDQRWRKITPLVTKCDDVKKLFGVEDCSAPTSHYDFKEYDLMLIVSAGKGEWKAQKGTVVQAVVFFKKLLKLEDFETDLKSYTVYPVDDLPGEVSYTNKKKGITLSLLEIDGEKFIRNLVLFNPSK
jgi:hypothetical protein